MAKQPKITPADIIVETAKYDKEHGTNFSDIAPIISQWMLDWGEYKAEDAIETFAMKLDI